MERIIVSACLLGLRTRYDGVSKLSKDLVRKLRDACVIPVCPEQLGGLPTPRSPAFITKRDGGDVLDGKARVKNGRGEDVTEQFLRGAREVARLAKMWKVKKAHMKSDSPSCGFGVTQGPKGKIAGNGVCAELLRRIGVDVRIAE
jgi:uncharacterized protein YbbK (DUF523 family)